MSTPVTTQTPQLHEEAWSELVNKNLPLVKYVLGKLSRNLPPSVDRDDLLAAGSLGLTEAARRYDPARKVPFHSYAIPRIWGAMLDELRSHDWLSAETREQVKRLEHSMAQLQEQGVEKPSIEDLSTALGVTTRRVNYLMSLAGADRQTSTDALPVELDENGTYARLGIRTRRGPYEEAELSDGKRALAEAIMALPERERQVIMLRYHEDLMLHEIGEILSVSESRVCQIQTQALQRLRTQLKRQGLCA